MKVRREIDAQRLSLHGVPWNIGCEYTGMSRISRCTQRLVIAAHTFAKNSAGAHSDWMLLQAPCMLRVEPAQLRICPANLRQCKSIVKHTEHMVFYLESRATRMRMMDCLQSLFDVHVVLGCLR